ncbi:MAG: response regulator, partial [Candidatus Omnitrophica bacterium]|nr:response regulator [Candidatus Omnitrophota bacterium]
MPDKAKILVIDDEKLVLLGLQRIVEDAGYEVKTSIRGKEAVEMVRSEKFDIIFTDMKMPEMDGVEVCDAIKKIDPEMNVILFSGTPQGLAKRQIDFLNVGGTDKYLRK